MLSDNQSSTLPTGGWRAGPTGADHMPGFLPGNWFWDRLKNFREFHNFARQTRQWGLDAVATDIFEMTKWAKSTIPSRGKKRKIFLPKIRLILKTSPQQTSIGNMYDESHCCWVRVREESVSRCSWHVRTWKLATAVASGKIHKQLVR